MLQVRIKPLLSAIFSDIVNFPLHWRNVRLRRIIESYLLLFFKRFKIFFGPPIIQEPNSSNFAPLLSKACDIREPLPRRFRRSFPMGSGLNYVRTLKDSGRENNLIVERIIISVYHRSRHSPDFSVRFFLVFAEIILVG